MLEYWEATCKLLYLGTDIIPFTTLNSKWIKDLHGKHKMTKLLEDNMGENLEDLGFHSVILDTTPKAQSMKKK